MELVPDQAGCAAPRHGRSRHRPSPTERCRIRLRRQQAFRARHTPLHCNKCAIQDYDRVIDGGRVEAGEVVGPK